MRLRLSLLVMSSWLSLITAPVAADPAALTPRGQWLRGDGVARVEVAPCGHDLCMTNVWIRPDVTGEKVGEFIRLDVKPTSPGRWTGTGYDPQRNLTFSTEMTVARDTMTTGGCLVGGLICKSTPWTRVP